MKLNALLDVDVVAVESEDRVSILLELEAPVRQGENRRAPGALQVVLDRSGSMAGDKLQAALVALDALVTRLDPADRFGLVVFDDAVDVVVPAQPLADKAAVREALRSIDPGGSTNLSGGLMRGIQEARTGAGAATLLLVSDGHANAGICDADNLATVARTAHGHGVSISTIGLGYDYDEALLAAVARAGSGNHRFAEDADAGAVAVAAEVEGLLDQVAQAATLAIRPTGDVAGIHLLHDLPTYLQENRVIVELGDLYSGEARKIVLTLDVPALSGLGLATVAELDLQWVDVATLATQTVTVPVSVNVVPGDEAAGRVPNPVVRTEVAFQEAQKAKREAGEALRRGDVAAAQGMLDDAGGALQYCIAEVPAAFAPELLDEVSLLRTMSEEAGADAGLTSKRLEEDSHYKNRKRGRGR